MLEAGARPTPEMRECGTKIFPSCLDLVKLSYIVVFEFEVWDHLPDERFSSSPGLERDVLHHLPNQYRADNAHQDRGWIGRYEYSGGASLAMKIKHASIGFSPAERHPVLNWFLRSSGMNR